MLEIRQQIGNRGVLIPLRISISSPREIAMRAVHRGIPKPVDCTALVDTGADCTLIDDSIIEELRILPTGTCSLTSLETLQTEQLHQFDVDIVFVADGKQSTRFTAKVAMKALRVDEYKVLLGRDLLQYCKLTYDGPAGEAAVQV